MTQKKQVSKISTYCDPRRWMSFDVESSGELPEYALQPWSEKAWLTSFSVSKIDSETGELESSVFPANYGEATDLAFEERLRTAIEIVLDTAIDYNYVLIGWNVAFDIAWLIKMGYGEKVMQVRWLDAMHAWKKLTRVPEAHLPHPLKKKYGLKEAVAEFVPEHAGYGEGVDFHSMDEPSVTKRLKYNKLDTGLSFILCQRFIKQLSHESRKKQLRNLLIESKCLPLIASHHVQGLFVDYEQCIRHGEDMDAETEEIRSRLAEHGATPEVLASPAQLSKLLYEDWKLPVLAKTPKGAPSTNKEALYELSFQDERANTIKRYRELQGNKTKFVDKLLSSLDYNGQGTTHPTANVDATYTGRMTFSSGIGKRGSKNFRQTGFALHQMKREASFRRPIKAPDGWVMVEWDAAGQEYRWVAIESKDETMLSLCQQGEDPHSYMAAEMTEYTYSELRNAYKSGAEGAYETRMAGKVGNLSCQYRIGWKALLRTARVQYGLPWDDAMSKHVHRVYRNTYSQVPPWWARSISRAKRKGYAETIAGRRVILEGDWGEKDRWRLESSAINFPIQGVGADQKYLAMACIKPLLLKYSGRFYFELHDGLYAIFPEKVAEKAGQEGKKLLSHLPYRKAWGFSPPIPLPWDLKIGPNWGDLKETH